VILLTQGFSEASPSISAGVRTVAAGFEGGTGVVIKQCRGIVILINWKLPAIDRNISMSGAG
jgi:hypothetical protein